MTYSRERKLAKHLLDIAGFCMPATYLQGDPRCKLAREVLNEHRIADEAFNEPLKFMKDAKVVSDSPRDVSFVYALKLDADSAIRFEELANERGLNGLQVLRELVDNYVDQQTSP